VSRIAFASGFAAGYVLGSRAGRARYEAIRRTARTLADRPEVQGVAGMLQAQAVAAARLAIGKVRRGPDASTLH
jgi:hypothetical protein